jgi:hypothetical protein
VLGIKRHQSIVHGSTSKKWKGKEVERHVRAKTKKEEEEKVWSISNSLSTARGIQAYLDLRGEFLSPRSFPILD